MATYKINGQLNIWFENVEIDAENEDEALNKLYKMDVKDIIDACYIHESDIIDEEVELTEADYKVRVKGIDYCVEYDDVADQVAERFPDVEEGSDDFDNLVTKEIIKIRESLPQSLDLELTCVGPEDLDDYISDMISEETGWLINGWESYEVLEIR